MPYIPSQLTDLDDVNASTLGPDSPYIKYDAASRRFVGVPGIVTRPFTFIQNTPSSVWVVVHNLGKRPAVSVEDSAGSIVQGDIHYDSDNQITLTFSAAFSGRADCN